ncbi:MAG: transcription antitermination factor NusB [Candidatus Hydrogenedentes bacterium]|nr:transcription antitermination factor NusB [Candidatus Hydrogenedentota bacterium]
MRVAGTRRKARCRALEFLFGLEFTKGDWRVTLDAFWKTFETRQSVRDYAETLVAGVLEDLSVLDEDIDASLKGWTPERVGRIERNVLRVAIFEMGSIDDVPPKVAINEAIELAKSYGSDESPGFVNAVLDRVMDTKYRESPA